MIRQILFLLILSCSLSCLQNEQVSKTETIGTSSDSTKISAKKNIRFDFSAKRLNSFKETIEINASIYNDNTDTIFFVSATCDGEQYSLRYDTSIFVLTPFVNCNASFPTIIKIAPHKQHNFQAHFRYRSMETKIKLGFDFYSLDKSFDLTNKSLSEINVFNRPENKQSIIWADEKTIK